MRFECFQSNCTFRRVEFGFLLNETNSLLLKNAPFKWNESRVELRWKQLSESTLEWAISFIALMICYGKVNLRFSNCFRLHSIIISMFCKTKIKRSALRQTKNIHVQEGPRAVFAHTAHTHTHVANWAAFLGQNKETIWCISILQWAICQLMSWFDHIKPNISKLLTV